MSKVKVDLERVQEPARLGMVDQWVTECGVCCRLRFFAYRFTADWTMTRGNLEGWDGTHIGTQLSRVQSILGYTIACHGHGDMGSRVWAVLAKCRCFCHFRPGLGHHISLRQWA